MNKLTQLNLLYKVWKSIKGFFLFKSPWRDIIQFALLIFILIWIMGISTANLGYNWQWSRIPKYIVKIVDGKASMGPLLKGLMLTFRISGISLVLAMLLGLVSALMRLSNSIVARIISRIYIEAIRNTPLLVQLFFIYFILGPILDLERFFSAVLALSLFEGAYASEIFRSGIVAIRRGQWEASHSLGLTGTDTYRFIILPQAIRTILPPLTSQAISLIKDSALVSLIALNDLTLQAQIVISDTFLTFEIWFTTAAMYLVITIILSTMVGLMEKKFSIRT